MEPIVISPKSAPVGAIVIYSLNAIRLTGTVEAWSPRGYARISQLGWKLPTELEVLDVIPPEATISLKISPASAPSGTSVLFMYNGIRSLGTIDKWSPGGYAYFTRLGWRHPTEITVLDVIPKKAKTK
jgi:hypothetical protein